MAGKPQKNLAYSVLLDFYGPVLTDKQRVILTEYYDEDLSLAEIAENLGITRQGVRDAIKHGEAALDELEQKLGNARRHTRMQADLDRLRLLVTEIRCSNSGSFTPDPRITNDTAEMLTILHRLDTQEDADGPISPRSNPTSIVVTFSQVKLLLTKAAGFKVVTLIPETVQ